MVLVGRARGIAAALASTLAVGLLAACGGGGGNQGGSAAPSPATSAVASPTGPAYDRASMQRLVDQATLPKDAMVPYGGPKEPDADRATGSTPWFPCGKESVAAGFSLGVRTREW